jgi:hypothetical protein
VGLQACNDQNRKNLHECAILLASFPTMNMEAIRFSEVAVTSRRLHRAKCTKQPTICWQSCEDLRVTTRLANAVSRRTALTGYEKAQNLDVAVYCECKLVVLVASNCTTAGKVLTGEVHAMSVFLKDTRRVSVQSRCTCAIHCMPKRLTVNSTVDFVRCHALHSEFQKTFFNHQLFNTFNCT